jgi:hypothetical protein
MQHTDNGIKTSLLLLLYINFLKISYSPIINSKYNGKLIVFVYDSSKFSRFSSLEFMKIQFNSYFEDIILNKYLGKK